MRRSPLPAVIVDKACGTLARCDDPVRNPTKGTSARARAPIQVVLRPQAVLADLLLAHLLGVADRRRPRLLTYEGDDAESWTRRAGNNAAVNHTGPATRISNSVVDLLSATYRLRRGSTRRGPGKPRATMRGGPVSVVGQRPAAVSPARGPTALAAASTSRPCSPAQRRRTRFRWPDRHGMLQHPMRRLLSSLSAPSPEGVIRRVGLGHVSRRPP